MNILYCGDANVCDGIFLSALSLAGQTQRALHVFILTADAGNHAAIPASFSEIEREQVRLFFYQGGYAVIRDWLNRDDRESPKKLAAFLYDIIGKMLQ